MTITITTTSTRATAATKSSPGEVGYAERVHWYCFQTKMSKDLIALSTLSTQVKESALDKSDHVHRSFFWPQPYSFVRPQWTGAKSKLKEDINGNEITNVCQDDALALVIDPTYLKPRPYIP